MDIFCQIKDRLKEQIIDKTTNFYIIHDGYPLMEGHLLLIPKKHIDCFLNLDKSLVKEFQKVKNKIINFLKNNYKPPIIFEHGIIGQTVPHAHLHFLPTDKQIENQLEKLSIITEKPEIPYLYLEFNGIMKFFKPKKMIKPGLLHSLYASVLDRPTDGLKRAKDLDMWLLKVKKRYKLWKEENH